jgi:hypothetical protein
MFIVNWMFDKLGYMPKINMEIGVVHQAWPSIVSKEMPKKPTVKKATTRKPAVAAKTARTKKVK